MPWCLDSRQTHPVHRADQVRRRERVARAGYASALLATLLVGSPSSDAATTDGGSWRPAEIVRADAKASYVGPVLHLPDGSTLAFWTSRGGHLLFSRRPAHSGWSPPQDLSGADSRVSAIEAIEDPHNEVTLFWRGTIGDEPGIWSQRFVDQAWTAPRREIVPEANFVQLSIAKASRWTAVQWLESDPSLE